MTPSNRIPKVWTAKFSDGQSARSWQATVRLDARGIFIARGDGQEGLVWPYGALKAHTPLSKNSEDALITYTYMPDAQLFVSHPDFALELIEKAPRLKAASYRWRAAKPLILATLLAIFVFGIIWVMDLKPARTIASMMPEGARQTIGRNVVNGFAAPRRVCRSAKGMAALDRLMSRLLDSIEHQNYFSITVIDWSLVNAFAAPGGQMIITSGLIRSARSPEEVAGVLAHEIGHGIELHPETGLVRAISLSAALELLTGGSSGTLSSLSGLIVKNSYARNDERAADKQALRLLKEAGISQDGLADFFERLNNKDRGAKSASYKTRKDEPILGSAFDLLRTHPYPQERARDVRETPAYASTPAMTPEEWRALRQICS